MTIRTCICGVCDDVGVVAVVGVDWLVAFDTGLALPPSVSGPLLNRKKQKKRNLVKKVQKPFWISFKRFWWSVALTYLCGKPVDGKSVFRGTVGLGAVVATCAGVDANTTEPPSEPCYSKRNKEISQLFINAKSISHCNCNWYAQFINLFLVWPSNQKQKRSKVNQFDARNRTNICCDSQFVINNFV